MDHVSNILQHCNWIARQEDAITYPDNIFMVYRILDTHIWRIQKDNIKSILRELQAEIDEGCDCYLGDSCHYNSRFIFTTENGWLNSVKYLLEHFDDKLLFEEVPITLFRHARVLNYISNHRWWQWINKGTCQPPLFANPKQTWSKANNCNTCFASSTSADINVFKLLHRKFGYMFHYKNIIHVCENYQEICNDLISMEPRDIYIVGLRKKRGRYIRIMEYILPRCEIASFTNDFLDPLIVCNMPLHIIKMAIHRSGRTIMQDISLLTAVRHKRLDIVRLLMEMDTPIPPKLFVEAVKSQCYSVIQYLTGCGRVDKSEYFKSNTGMNELAIYGYLLAYSE